MLNVKHRLLLTDGTTDTSKTFLFLHFHSLSLMLKSLSFRCSYIMSQPVVLMLTGDPKFSIRDKQKGKYINI